jgi:hypothetical protein
MSNKDELKVVAPARYEDIEIRVAADDTDGMSKTAANYVSDVDHGNFSGKEAYGKSLDAAIDFLWSKANENVSVDPASRTSVERAAAYYAMLDTAISSIVTADAAAAISKEQISRLDEVRAEINTRNKVILASVLSKHVKPNDSDCQSCGALLFEDKCVVCGDETNQLIKQAGTPSLEFHETGFIVGLATDLVQYVVTSGMNMTDGIKIARDTFGLSPREEYRLRKYLNYMGHQAPQMIWLPASENRLA